MPIGTPSVFPFSLEDAGATFRASFVVRTMDDNGNQEWHYFGITESEPGYSRAELEPNIPYLQTLPYFEHPYVAFPSAMADIPDEARNMIYDIAIPAGLNREGLW